MHACIMHAFAAPTARCKPIDVRAHRAAPRRLNASPRPPYGAPRVFAGRRAVAAPRRATPSPAVQKRSRPPSRGAGARADAEGATVVLMIFSGLFLFGKFNLWRFAIRLHLAATFWDQYFVTIRRFPNFQTD